MLEQGINDTVQAWLKSHNNWFEVCTNEPAVAWLVIIRMLDIDLTQKQIAWLAAGPMETLLAYHGPSFIDRIEHEARRNARFNYLLGGVWHHKMTQQIWERVENVRKQLW